MSSIAQLNYAPSFWKLYNKYKNIKIFKIVVMRTKVPQVYDKIIEILSLGTWSNLKKKYGYETFYHIGVIFYLTNGIKLLYEKNSIVSLSVITKIPKEAELMTVPYDGNLTLEIIVRKTEHLMGDRYFRYNAFGEPPNNCQTFIISVLQANDLINENLKKFIDQDTEQIVSQSPEFLKKISKTITDFGSVFEHGYDIVKNQLGYRRGGRVEIF